MRKSTTMSELKKEMKDALDGIFITSWETMLKDFKDSIDLHWQGYDEFEIWDRDSLMTLKTTNVERIIDAIIKDDLSKFEPPFAGASLNALADELDKASKRVRNFANELKAHA